MESEKRSKERKKKKKPFSCDKYCVQILKISKENKREREREETFSNFGAEEKRFKLAKGI